MSIFKTFIFGVLVVITMTVTTATWSKDSLEILPRQQCDLFCPGICEFNQDKCSCRCSKGIWESITKNDDFQSKGLAAQSQPDKLAERSIVLQHLNTKNRAMPTKAQVNKAISNQIKNLKNPAAKAALIEYQKMSSMREKRDWLDGKNFIMIPKSMSELGTSLPKCVPRYGCKFRSVCKPSWWSDSVNDCTTTVDDCPDQICD